MGDLGYEALGNPRPLHYFECGGSLINQFESGVFLTSVSRRLNLET